jgi:hypothetical protein
MILAMVVPSSDVITIFINPTRRSHTNPRINVLLEVARERLSLSCSRLEEPDLEDAIDLFSACSRLASDAVRVSFVSGLPAHVGTDEPFIIPSGLSGLRVPAGTTCRDGFMFVADACVIAFEDDVCVWSTLPLSTSTRGVLVPSANNNMSSSPCVAVGVREVSSTAKSLVLAQLPRVLDMRLRKGRLAAFDTGSIWTGSAWGAPGTLNG